MLPALSIDGIIYSTIRQGSFDGPGFVDFICRLLPFMNPYPGPRSILVIDNCRIHHVDEVQELCDEHGVALRYLPAYSPDMNPIEESFSFVKAWIRRNGDQFREAFESGETALLYIILYEALDRVTANDSHKWFEHSGYI